MRTIIPMLIIAVLIGYQAQTTRGRTGAAWGFITLVAEAAVFGFFYLSVGITAGEMLREEDTWFGLRLVSIVATGVVMALIVKTLPNKSR